MYNSLETYALIKALYDKQQEYIDCFWPFVLQVMSSSNVSNLMLIQEALKTKIDIDIPIHVISSLIKRAKKKEYIKQIDNKKEYILTKKGEKYVENFEPQRDVHRRLESLYISAQEYFKKQSFDLPKMTVMGILNGFVEKNRKTLIEFINPNAKVTQRIFESSNEQVKILINFIYHIEKEKPNEFNILKDLILGSLISTIVFSRESSNIDTIGKAKFKGYKVYLDTNIVFSIFGFHEHEANLASKELLKLLMNFNFDIRVFPSTITELCNVLKRYRVEYYKYPQSIKVDTGSPPI